MHIDKRDIKDLYRIIAESSIYGNLGCFIGAGLPMAVLNDDWTKVALSWKELIFKCAESMQIDFKDIQKEGVSYPEIATSLCKLYAKQENKKYEYAVKKLKETIAKLTCWYPSVEKRDEYKKYFESLDPDWIITTNYDFVIESILTGKAYSLSSENQLVAPKGLIPVYHLHGLRTNPDSIIITQEDYTSLFRPNQYRLQKLPLTIKESVTILIGYSLGDFNVLTAVDFSKNVYSEQKTKYPNEIIQFLYVENPEFEPYKDINNIWVIEFNNLSNLLSEIKEFVDKAKADYHERQSQLADINNFLSNPDSDNVKSFVDDNTFRLQTLELLEENQDYVISGFLEIVSKSIELTWERSGPKGAFEAYNQNLTILMDILEHLSLKVMPPALVEFVAYNLDNVSYYIGSEYGQSYSANNTWNSRKLNIPKETLEELKNISQARQYYKLKRLLNF